MLNSGDPVEIGELLTYLRAYRVVLCKQCKFAIQPNALSSHLQKHKILRGKRRNLLDQLSRLELIAPSKVCSPPISAPPIQGLACYDGYRCVRESCEYACTSEKRMAQHWSQVHNSRNHLEVQARAVKLQTFFRGTQNHYFEVSEDVDFDSNRTNVHPQKPPNLDTPQSISPISNDENSRKSGIDGFDSLNLKAMMYLHFFTISSGICMNLGLGSDTFWTHDLPRQAPEHPFLLYALLGIAACHQACITQGSDEAYEHIRAARHYSALSMPLFRAGMMTPDIHNGTALAASSRCLGIIDLVLSRLGDEEKLQGTACTMTSPEAIQQLNKFTVMMRGSLDMLIDLQNYVDKSSGMRLVEADKARLTKVALISGIDAEVQMPILYSQQTASDYSEVEAQDYAQIRLLPSRLMAVGAVIEEVSLASRCAGALLEILQECDEATHESQWREWSIRQGWAQTVAAKEYLMPALNQGLPSAIVTYAYWIYHIIRPTEPSYWFTTRISSYLVQLCKVALKSEAKYLALLDDLTFD